MTVETHGRRWLQLLGALHDWLTDLGVQCAKIGVFAILMLYLWEVFSRYFLGASNWWATEYVPYLMCAATFLMAPAITRDRGHVAMDALSTVVPVRFARHRQALILIICVATGALLTWISLNESIRQVVQDVGLLRGTLTPKVYVSAWIVYGFASSTLYFLRMLFSIDANALNPAQEIGAL